jgi:hypothetical protein
MKVHVVALAYHHFVARRVLHVLAYVEVHEEIEPEESLRQAREFGHVELRGPVVVHGQLLRQAQLVQYAEDRGEAQRLDARCNNG